MIVNLDAEFLEIAKPAFLEHAALIEFLLLRHAERRILLSLPPAIISRVERDLHLGVLSAATLKSIKGRYLDYGSVGASVKFSIRVLPDGSEIVPTVNHEVFAAKSDVVINFLKDPPKLFLENAPNDGRFYKLLVELFHKKSGFPSGLCFSETFHGGGTALGAAMADLDTKILAGICICDRDTSGVAPPFPKGKTGEAALNAAVSKGAFTNGVSLVPAHPFFALLATLGWSMENYVGPNLLDLYFSCNPGACDLRPKFFEAFPNFPELSERESREWFISYLKEFQDGASVGEGVKRLRGDTSGARNGAIGALQIPGSTIDWALGNARGTRYSKEIMTAINKDLSIEFYSDGVREIATRYAEIFTADSNASLI
ncbi:hypothetical protein [Rhodovulum kholense]|uniref:Uncharacterized protein n=1 Tax=Rhodovulum kholense TaxID=453584 RepID=A0A8E2VHJ6_9RHOB|nr:hypothetical protein [Rhodovulum kholense]PTW37598.1 hypothetical protein C8N38_13115 [Rhodovulum kholense]